MTPELEALLKAWDEFIQTPVGPEAERVYVVYQSQLTDLAARSKMSVEVLDRTIRRYHQRWVRANLPEGFPKQLGLE
jgi:hypothetical protein